MIEGSSTNNSSGLPGWGTWLYSRRESIWYVLVFIVPFLTIKILIASNHALSDFKSTGQFSYPDGYVLIAIITLLLCVLVLFLLKDSEPSFRQGAVVLTAILPALLIGWVWFAMLRFVEQEQLYKTSDPVGHYFVTRRAYESYRNQYRKAEAHKAIAQSKSGAWSWTADHGTAMEAAEAALVRCMKINETNEAQYPCEIINLDNKWEE